jgi:ABC-type transport system involved in multi-copper enzyme maturation permease subunit
MLAEVRSELTRTRRRGVLLGWAGLTAVFAVLVNLVMFQAVGDGTAPPGDGPGVSFPSAAELAGPGGSVAGLAAAANLLGVVTLAFWAILTATDYSTGLIRLLASAQPRRGRLLAGKLGALALSTAGTSVVALVACLAAAPAAARSAGIDTAAWSDDVLPTVLGAWVNLLCALLVWGVVGFVLATLSRSAAVAISVGVGYVLVVEAVIEAAVGSAADWLPGTTLAALAQGGSASLPYLGALGLGAAYTALGVAVAALVVRRRDITD